MQNEHCLLYSELKTLWLNKHKEMLLQLIDKHKDIFTLEEMKNQMEKDSGDFNICFQKYTSKFTNKTENVEVLMALELSDFYFPSKETQICFEMRREFSQTSIVGYDDLVTNIENNTYIDCSVRSEGRNFNFQIKRYPQMSKDYSDSAIVEYIQDVIEEYSNDMKGTVLVFLLQPDPIQQDSLDFKAIHKNLLEIKNKISFEEIDFIFNLNNDEIIWHQVFPGCGHSKKPLVLLSEKFKMFN